MLKLYRTIGGELHYHEAWVNENEIITHWGKVGERGQFVGHQLRPGESAEEGIARTLAQPMRDGFQPIPEEDWALLWIEFVIEGFGTAEDLDKRHSLEDRMNETLGWTGLGHCDGGSIGSGTMEVCCIVVDFELAKRVIEIDLKDTEYANYSQIYQT